MDVEIVPQYLFRALNATWGCNIAVVVKACMNELTISDKTKELCKKFQNKFDFGMKNGD